MERRTAGGLVLPANVSGVREVQFACVLCGREFYDDEERAFGLHVAKCAKRHEPEINAASPRTIAPAFFTDEGWDGEYNQWVRDNPEAWKRERGIDR